MNKCKDCGYEWHYKGQHYWASCPRCMSKQKINEVKKNEV
jgi:predicted Zn-ribbon and HTH transcriptional regulator